MAPVRIDSRLIDKQKSALDKLEKQSRSWILFFVITSFCLIFLTSLGYIINSNILESKTDYLFIAVACICLFWWFWTINFIYHAVKNQKIIYAILTDIEIEIKNIKNNIVNNDKK